MQALFSFTHLATLLSTCIHTFTPHIHSDPTQNSSRSVLDLGSSSDRLWALTFGRKLRTQPSGIFRNFCTFTPPTTHTLHPIWPDKPHNNFSQHIKYSHKFPRPSDNTSESRLRDVIPQSCFLGTFYFRSSSENRPLPDSTRRNFQQLLSTRRIHP